MKTANHTVTLCTNISAEQHAVTEKYAKMGGTTFREQVREKLEDIQKQYVPEEERLGWAPVEIDVRQQKALRPLRTDPDPTLLGGVVAAAATEGPEDEEQAQGHDFSMEM